MDDIVAKALAEDDFVTLEDGFKYYWVRRAVGAIAAYQLRQLADYLDEQNKEAEDQLKEYFAASTMGKEDLP